MMKTCVIMGNGPSLLEMPKDILTQYDSFGVNYCLYQPTFYVCVDRDLLVNHHAEIRPFVAAAKTAFLAEKERGTSDLYDLPNVFTVTKDAGAFSDEHFFTGLTVVYMALKIAYYENYQRVHLWGVDHSADWKHYREGYPETSPQTRAARMQEMEYHYRLAQRVYTLDGRRIVNHSAHSKLNAIFPRK